MHIIVSRNDTPETVSLEFLLSKLSTYYTFSIQDTMTISSVMQYPTLSVARHIFPIAETDPRGIIVFQLLNGISDLKYLLAILINEAEGVIKLPYRLSALEGLHCQFSSVSYE